MVADESEWRLDNVVGVLIRRDGSVRVGGTVRWWRMNRPGIGHPVGGVLIRRERSVRVGGIVRW